MKKINFERLLWFVAAVILFFLNAAAIICCVLFHNPVFTIALIVLVVADWLYKEKCPVWLEV